MTRTNTITINEMKQSRNGRQNQSKDHCTCMNVLDPAFCFESSVVEWKHDTPTEAKGMKCHPHSDLNYRISVHNTCVCIHVSIYAIKLIISTIKLVHAYMYAACMSHEAHQILCRKDCCSPDCQRNCQSCRTLLPYPWSQLSERALQACEVNGNVHRVL